MQIKVKKSQFGIDENSIHDAKDYGDFYLVIIGSQSYEVEKTNAEIV